MNATFSKKPEIFKFRDQTTRPDNDVKPGILQNETFEMKPKVSDTDHSLKKVRGPYNSKSKDKTKTKQLVTEETARIVETLYSRRPDMVFTCLKCEYTSIQRGHLKEHVEKHIEGLKYFCSFCNKKSSTSQSLRGHMQKYHWSRSKKKKHGDNHISATTVQCYWGAIWNIYFSKYEEHHRLGACLACPYTAKQRCHRRNQ